MSLNLLGRPRVTHIGGNHYQPILYGILYTVCYGVLYIRYIHCGILRYIYGMYTVYYGISYYGILFMVYYISYIVWATILYGE